MQMSWKKKLDYLMVETTESMFSNFLNQNNFGSDLNLYGETALLVYMIVNWV